MHIKRLVSKKLTLYKGKNFPFKNKKSHKHRYKAVIGIGGNVGDTKRRFERLLIFLKRDRFLDVIQTSSILKNPPFGYLNQDFFYNGIIVVKTPLTPLKLLTHLQNIEKKFRRKRSFKDAPRTLDLDIIFYKDKVLNTKKLTIPHKEWFKRESVVIPLMEVDI